MMHPFHRDPEKLSAQAEDDANRTENLGRLSWERDLANYLQLSNKGDHNHHPIRLELAKSIQADPQSATAWWALLRHEEALSPTPTLPAATPRGTPRTPTTNLCDLYRWATRLVPRQQHASSGPPPPSTTTASTTSSFVNLWLGFARQQWLRDCHDDARDTFKTLKSQQIGEEYAVMYAEWAGLEALTGNSSKAASIVYKGLKTGAEPRSVLEKMKNNLEQGLYTYVPFYCLLSEDTAEAEAPAAVPEVGRRNTVDADVPLLKLPSCIGSGGTGLLVPPPPPTTMTTVHSHHTIISTSSSGGGSSARGGGEGSTRSHTTPAGVTSVSLGRTGSSAGTSHGGSGGEESTVNCLQAVHAQHQGMTLVRLGSSGSGMQTIAESAVKGGGSGGQVNENGSHNQYQLQQQQQRGAMAPKLVSGSGGASLKVGLGRAMRVASSATTMTSVQDGAMATPGQGAMTTMSAHTYTQHHPQYHHQQQQPPLSSSQFRTPAAAAAATRLQNLHSTHTATTSTPLLMTPATEGRGGAVRSIASRQLVLEEGPAVGAEEATVRVVATTTSQHHHRGEGGANVSASVHRTAAIPEEPMPSSAGGGGSAAILRGSPGPRQPQPSQQPQQPRPMNASTTTAMQPPPPRPPSAQATQNNSSIAAAAVQQQQPSSKRVVVEDEDSVTVRGITYTKLECVGRGGSSKVYKVMAPNKKIFALKRIRLNGCDAEAAAGFLDEITLLTKLRGKSNIIQLIDSEVHRNQSLIYMVLEYGDIDLARLLQKHGATRKERNGGNDPAPGEMHPADENFIRLYWQQMLQAVDTIHRERIVHSDLKPANFLVVEGQLKLIDFGIAKAIQADTTSIARESQVGTLNYMSPEAILGGGGGGGRQQVFKVGRASDIWSLGCILYQMVYGRTPFAHLPFIQKMHAITNDRYHITFPAPVRNAALMDVMNRCLDRNPRTRITMEALLEHPFLGIGDGGGGGGGGKQSSKDGRVQLNEEQLKRLLMKVSQTGGLSDTNVEYLSEQLFKQLVQGTLSPDVVAAKMARRQQQQQQEEEGGEVRRGNDENVRPMYMQHF